MSNQQEVFLVIDSVDWCDQWEPENDVRCLLKWFDDSMYDDPMDI